MQSFDLPRKIGHYTLTRFLGRGGMGEVFLATDDLLRREVAIKFLLLQDADPKMRSRFLSEARAVAALNHPNIVIIHDVGETEQKGCEIPALYLVMEYIEGKSLDLILESHRLSIN